MPGTIALCTFYDGKGDNMLAPCASPPKGYKKVRVEGYGVAGAGTKASMPLTQYLDKTTQKHWAVDAAWAANAKTDG